MDNLQFQSKWIMHKILLHFTAIERQLLLAEWFNVEGVYFFLTRELYSLYVRRLSLLK